MRRDNPQKNRIFISHSLRDTELAQRLRQQLSAQENFTISLPEEEVARGQGITAKMLEGIRGSDFIVVLLNPGSARFADSVFEMGVAVGLGKQVLAILPSDADASSIPFDLRDKLSIVSNTPKRTAEAVRNILRERAELAERATRPENREARRAEIIAKIEQNIEKNRERIRKAEKGLFRFQAKADELKTKISETKNEKWKDIWAGWLAETEAKIADIEAQIRRVKGWIEEEQRRLHEVGAKVA